jgi:hypothetical protein
MAIKVLEVDQWTSTGNVRDYNFKSFTLDNVVGGDSAAAKAIFGGYARIYDVQENQRPSKGYVWFTEVEERFKLYKANYDSSD